MEPDLYASQQTATPRTISSQSQRTTPRTGRQSSLRSNSAAGQESGDGLPLSSPVSEQPVESTLRSSKASQSTSSTYVQVELPPLAYQNPTERDFEQTGSRFRGRSKSPSGSARTSGSYLDRLHGLLDHYDLFASTAARLVPLDSFPKNMKRDKRTFILRSKTERAKAELLRKIINPTGAVGDRYDYEQKYPADEPEQACGPNARVWRAYLDEAGQFDLDMVENIRDTVDVILVFAGLFSAIVSTVVSQASAALQLDYAQVTAALMMELIAVQRAIATGSSLEGINPSPLNTESLNSATSSTSDRWVNGLWFTSLAFSLSTALIAVLIKQWIQAYVAPTFGTPQEQSRMRHFRFMGIEKWHVPLIVGLLPTLLHISLFVFLLGLVVFLLALDQRIAWVVAGIGITAFLAYVTTNVLPLWYPQCPYKTPISSYSMVLFPFLGRLIYGTPFIGRISYAAVWLSEALFSQLQKAHRHLFPPSRASDTKRSTPKIRTLKDEELRAVKKDGEQLGAHIFNWMCHTSSNPSVQTIVNHAVSELPHETQPSTREILRQVVLPRICDGVESFCSRHRVGEEYQVPPPDEAHALCDLLAAHVNATRSTTKHHLYDGFNCDCSIPSSGMLRLVDIPRLEEHPLTPFAHSFIHKGVFQLLNTLNPIDLIALRSSCKSKHIWLAILRHQVAAERDRSTVKYSYRWSSHPWKDGRPALSAWWPSLQPIIDTLLSPSADSKDVFANMEKTLLSAYLCYYTRPAALKPDDHELLTMALWHTDAQPDQWTSGEAVYRAVAHYISLVYLHSACSNSRPDYLGPSIFRFRRSNHGMLQHALVEMGDIDWDLTKNPRMDHGIHALPYFLPCPAVFKEIIQLNQSSPRSNETPLALLILELIRSVMALQNLPDICDAFRDNDCLQVLQLCYEHRHSRPRVGEYEQGVMTSITAEYLRAVKSQTDAAWKQKHLDYAFEHVHNIVDRWGWSASLRERGEVAADLRYLVEMQPHRAEWKQVLLRLDHGFEEFYGPQRARLLRVELAKAGRIDCLAVISNGTPARARQAIASWWSGGGPGGRESR